MFGQRILTLDPLSKLIVGLPFDRLPVSVVLQDRLPRCVGYHAPFAAKEFQAVVFRRIVAGRDLNPAGRLLVGD